MNAGARYNGVHRNKHGKLMLSNPHSRKKKSSNNSSGENDQESMMVTTMNGKVDAYNLEKETKYVGVFLSILGNVQLFVLAVAFVHLFTGSLVHLFTCSLVHLC